MGKNKKYADYLKPEKSEVVEPVVEEVKEEPVVEEPVQEEVVEEVEEGVDAVVDGVDSHLNVRKDPKVEPNNQVAIVSKGTKLIVMKPTNEKPINNDGESWYKVKTNDQVGYAMKKYIRIL